MHGILKMSFLSASTASALGNDGNHTQITTSAVQEPLTPQVYTQLEKVKNGSSKSAFLLNQNIADHHIPELCNEFDKCGANLETVILWENKITSTGAEALFKYMETNNSITKMHLGGNNIGDKGARSAATMLSMNKTLKELTLGSVHGGCGITDDGIIHLAKSLIGNTTLTELDIWNNKGITDASIPALRDMMMNSHIFDHGSETDIFFMTSIAEEAQAELKALAQVPIKNRTFPLVRRS